MSTAPTEPTLKLLRHPAARQTLLFFGIGAVIGVFAALSLVSGAFLAAAELTALAAVAGWFGWKLRAQLIAAQLLTWGTQTSREPPSRSSRGRRTRPSSQPRSASISRASRCATGGS